MYKRQVWFHESTLHESGAVKAVVDKLLELGACYKAEDGAIKMCIRDRLSSFTW